MTPPPTPVVDTHVHLWNLAHPTLRWNWVDTEDDHPVLGDIDPIKMPAFEMQHLWAEARFAGVAGFVHVQAAIGSRDPVDETRWLTEMAGEHPRLQAIVGHVDLGAADAAEMIERHLESPLFRGVRDFAVEPYLASGTVDPTVEESLACLARQQLVLDMDCEHPNMAAARAMAERHPDLVVVLEHIGFPRSRDPEYAAAWRLAVTDLASAPNVVCKLSGVAMTDRLFTRDSLAPWIRHCLETFGPSRCMVGTNWPLDRMCSSYDAIMSLYRDFAGELSEEESRQVLAGTAQRVYRIAGDEPDA
jgi:predicted TIM-barrel fold metal-dependent hydrolase